MNFRLRMLVVACQVACHAGAQNVVDVTEETAVAPPMKVSSAQVEGVIDQALSPNPTLRSQEAQQVAKRLNAHVAELINGWPWLPFHHTLGIGGYQAYFCHPDELFYALALAAPCLDSETLAAVKTFGNEQLRVAPPYQEKDWELPGGNAREPYDVPLAIRQKSSFQPRSAFGVYSFWAWCHYTQQEALAQEHWTALRERMGSLLQSDYEFDPARKDYTRDEAQKLNGDLAGLIGFVRLAKRNNDPEAATLSKERLCQLLELRLNLERINSHIIEKTTASKNLHAYKPPRYCDLVPELGWFLSRETQGLATKRLKVFRERRNAWYLAFGDRFIGGENYTNPLDFPRSLFASAAFIEQLPAAELLTFIDVPWCKADFYFIEKCAYALWADSGRYTEGTVAQPNHDSIFRLSLNDSAIFFIKVNSGEFKMGSEATEGEAAKEQPIHKVKIAREFYLGCTEVTLGQFRVFVNATAYVTDAEKAGWAYGRSPLGGHVQGAHWKKLEWELTEEHPALCSWNDATAFCTWLSQQSGKVIRLPSEAEWEYACRAGTLTDYSCPLEDCFKAGWHAMNSAMMTHPVGKKSANPWGFYDIHGNAWEWCQDLYHPDYSGAPNDGSAWMTGTGQMGTYKKKLIFRMLRGGAYNRPYPCMRSACRMAAPQDSTSNFGFRLVMDIPQHKARNP